METQNYSIWREVLFKPIKICRRKAVSNMLFMVTCLIVLSFTHIDASASNNINTTVTIKSVVRPTTYTALIDTEKPPETGRNIVNYELSEIVGTEDIGEIVVPPERDIEVMVLDNSETDSDETLIMNGSCGEPTVVYDVRNSNLVEEGSPNNDEKLYRYAITDDEYQILLRVVEAEVTGEKFAYHGTEVSREDLLKAKIRVAQVFLNRVEDTSKFKEDKSLKDALLRPGATSTLIDGRYYEVSITDITREAVEIALLNDTEDYTQNALFFSSGTTYCAYGDYLFTDEVGHSFFK